MKILTRLYIILLIFCVLASAKQSEALEQKFKSQVFTVSKQCKEKCHEQNYKEWATSMHAYAWTDPLFQKSYHKASEESGGKSDRFCIKCHAPVAYVADEVPPIDGSNMSDIAKNGNQCDICHIISQINEPVGNASFDIEPGQDKRGPRKNGQTKNHKIKYSEMHTQSIFCASCHELRHPETGVSLISTYSEWLESPYNEDDPEENVECQHCHMSPGIVKLVKRPGQSAAEGIIRDHIPTHYFVGGSTVVAEMMGQEKHKEEALKRLRMAAKIEILDAAQDAGKLNFTVQVTNVGAGHSLPTGMNQVRRVWLEVTVRDAAGNAIYESGVQNENEELPEGSIVYEAAYADASGKRTYSFWNTAKILYDTRLKAKKKRQHPFSVPVKGAGPYAVKAILRYQSPTPPMARKYYSKDEMKIPPVDMGMAEASIQ